MPASPVGLAAANAVLDIIEEEKLAEKAIELGKVIKGRLEDMAKKNEFSAIGDVRGIGAMVAVELVKDRVSKTPNADLVNAVIAKAQDKGLLLLSCGTNANVIRFLPPLTAGTTLAKEGMDVFEAAMREAVGAV